MQDGNRQRIANHYLQIWDDFQVIQFMDLNIAERAELHKMYCEEVRLVPDNSWCGPCVVEWLKELVFHYKADLVAKHASYVPEMVDSKDYPNLSNLINKSL